MAQPSSQTQMDPEEKLKLNRSPQNERRSYKCYNCEEFGHLQFNYMKNKFKNGKDDNQPKKVYCLKPAEATERSSNQGSASVSMATGTTENFDLPLAQIIHCFLVKAEDIFGS